MNQPLTVSNFQGSYVALVTPFHKNRLDEKKIKSLVEFHIENQSDGLVPCGTTGESPTLSHEEHRRVIELVVKAARGRLPVMAGAGSNSTDETLDLVRYSEHVGADAVLLVVPYYNKPTPRGLFEHFKTIAKATKLPIILYNIPGRSAVNLPAETTIQLARECPNIIGIKEASGSMDYSSQLFSTLGKDRFVIFSGDDSLTLPLMSLGARGIISVLGNILPAAVSEMCRSWLRGDHGHALGIHLQLFPLMRALFLETNPIPVKTAMGLLGLCRDELRLPLCPMGEENRKKLVAALNSCPWVKK